MWRYWRHTTSTAAGFLMLDAPFTTDPPTRMAINMAQQRVEAMTGWAFVHIRVVRQGRQVRVLEDCHE